MKTPLRVRVGQLRIGQTRSFGPNGEPSAIDKRTVDRTLWLGRTGFADDQQGDPRHHGGTEKAVHHYPAEHYADWRRELPATVHTTLQPGGFGENLSTSGLTESTVCIGDRWRLGEALLEVSQPRKPCWKLNVRFGLADMARRVQASGRIGWYYRVLQPGPVEPDTPLELLERPHPDWPLARLLETLWDAQGDHKALAEMASLTVLAPAWRDPARRRLVSGEIEASTARLVTPTVGGDDPAG